MTKKCVVIGFGYWGPNWARTLEESPFSELVAIVDKSEARLAKARGLHPRTRLCDDVLKLSGMELDLAIIATPPNSHLNVVSNLAQIGVDSIIIEKPMALSLREAQDIYQTADQYGTKIAVDYPYIYSQPVRKIKAILQDSPNVEYVESQRHNLGIFRPDMNVVWDLSVHDLSIFDFLFGPLKDIEVSCSTTNSFGSPHPSSGLLQIRGHGIPQLVSSVSWISPAKVRRFVTHAAGRMIAWDDTDQAEPLKVFETDVNVGENALFQYRIGSTFAPSLIPISPLETLLHEVTSTDSEFNFDEDRLRTIRIIETLELASVSSELDSRFVTKRQG